MKRTIMTIFEFNKKQIVINAYEKLSSDNSIIRLLRLSDKLHLADHLIPIALSKINSLTKVAVKDVFVVANETLETSAKIKLLKVLVPLKNNKVTDEAISAAYAQASAQVKGENRTLISLHPLQFVVDNLTKSYYQKAPLLTSGKNLLVKFATTSISNQTYNFINEKLRAHNLGIIQILTNKQALSSFFLSKKATENGAILITFNEKETFTTINKSGATIVAFTIQNAELANLYQKIATYFGCSCLEAKNVVLTYGSLEPPQSKTIIYTKHNSVEETFFTNVQLYKIIDSYFQKIVKIINQYTTKNQINHLPIVIAGEITKIDGVLAFMHRNLSKNLVLHNPIQYLEVDPSNAVALGVIKHKIHNNVYNYGIFKAKSNVNALAELVQESKSKQTVFNKFISKIGEKYERSN